MRPLFAELIGFPGAGKTTIAKAAVERLRAAACDPFFYSKDGKYRFAADDLGSAIRQCGRAASLLATRPDAALRRLLRFLPVFDKTLVFRRVRRRHRDHPLVLFDQGLIQKLYLMREGDRLGAGDIDAVMQLLRPDLAELHIVIDTPPADAAERYFNRAKSSARRPYQQWDEARIAALYAAQRDVLEAILAWLGSEAGAPVLRLDGEAPAQQNGARLAEWVIDRLGAQR